MGEKVLKLEQTKYYPSAAFYFRTNAEILRFKHWIENRWLHIHWDPVVEVDIKELSRYHKETLDLSPEAKAEKNQDWIYSMSKHHGGGLNEKEQATLRALVSKLSN